MQLRPDTTLHPLPGDFASRVVGGDLLVPPQVLKVAEAARLSTAEEFAGYAEAFPSSLGASLGWKPAAVLQAVSRLQRQLNEAGITFAAPAPPRTRNYGFGA